MDTMSDSPSISMHTDEVEENGFTVLPAWGGRGYPQELFAEKNLSKRTPLFCGYHDPSEPSQEKHVLRDPVQLTCGHRLCKLCMEEMKSLRTVQMCQQCIHESEMDDLSQQREPVIVPPIDFNHWAKDGPAAREVDRLMVYCPYECESEKRELLRVKNLQNHMATCDQRKVRCHLCYAEMLYRDFTNHANNECPERQVTCRYDCGAELRARDLENHSYYCTAKPNLCLFCNKGMYFGQEKHMEECFCRCPLGCEDDSKVKIKHHLADPVYLLTHLMHLLSGLTSMGVNLLGGDVENRLQSTTDSMQDDPNRDRLITMGRLLKLDAHQSETKSLIINEVLAVSNERDAEQMSQNITRLLDLVSTSIKPTQLLSECKGATRALRRDMEILSGFGKRFEELKETVSREEGFTNDAIAEIESKAKDQDERFEYQKALFEQYKWESQDGKFLWAIEDLDTLREKCRIQGQEFILSPPFYTEKFGRKMCIRLWINGKGVGAGTHMSVELMLMKGDYDPILAWPFLYKVNFKLVDMRRIPHPQHHTWRSKSTCNTDYWSRQPLHTINDFGYGIEKFIDHVTLFDSTRGFVKNNKMYLFCEVFPEVDSTPAKPDEGKERMDTSGGERTASVKH